jgi:hypothetical protein
MHRAVTSWRSWGLAIPILLWLVSFFLPVIIFPPDNASHWAPADGMQRGYDAALLSFAGGVMNAVVLADAISGGHISAAVLRSVDGLLWLANLWMIIAPFRIRSLSRGRSTPFLITIWLWVAAPFQIFRASFQRGSDGLRPYTLHVGFFFWWISLFLVAFLCTAIRFSQSPELGPYPAPASQTDRQL